MVFSMWSSSFPFSWSWPVDPMHPWALASCESYGDCVWLEPSLSDWDVKTLWDMRGKQLDRWPTKKITMLLDKLGRFDLVDESRSGKLGQKGRGMWRLTQRMRYGGQYDLDLWNQEYDMFYSFWCEEFVYETPKLVSYASTVGKHELVQKMLALGSLNQKSWLARQFHGYVKYLLKDQFGCLVLQQLLYEATFVVSSFGFDTSKFVENVVGALRRDLLASQAIVESSTDQHGNYVVQKWIVLLQCLPSQEDSLWQVFQQVGGNASTIGITQTGCRVIQRLLEIPSENELMEKLLEDDTFTQLVTSQFGNYVVQHMLSDHRRLEVFQAIYNNFASQAAGNFKGEEYDGFYACHRYGRFVVKKCLLMPKDSCQGWSDLLESLLRMVLEADGTPKPEFQCLQSSDGQYILQEMKNRLHDSGNEVLARNCFAPTP